MTETPSFDVRIKSNSTAPAPTLGYLNVGEQSGIKYRSLLLFKLDKVPQLLKKATLSLFWFDPTKARVKDTIIEIYRPAAWTPESVTWFNYAAGKAWKKGGGDWYDKNGALGGYAPFASVRIPANKLCMDGQWIDFDVTQLVSNYQTKKFVNTGFLVRARTEGGNYLAFASLESGKNQPKLEYAAAEPPVIVVPPVVTVPTPPAGNTIYLNATGSKDNIAINQALETASKNKGTVFLRGPAVYDIADSLLFGSNTTLDCGKGTILKLAEGLLVWGFRGASIAQEKAMLMTRGSTASNILVKNVTIDGSQSDYYPHLTLGWSMFNMCTMIGCTGLTFQNVTLKNGCNDAIMLSRCSNVLIDGIKVDECGHDGIYAYNVKNITVRNSGFINRTNSSCRFYNVTDGVFANNDCTTSGGGYAGLELEGAVTNIDVDGNNFHGLHGPAIAYVNCTKTNVNVRSNNKIVNCG